jgi:hypothetical protein
MARSTKAKGSRGAAQRARSAAQSATTNPYIRRLIEDEELRDNIRSAYVSAKSAYGRVSNGKGPTTALLDDKKVHKDLRNAAQSLREATDALREKGRRRTWPRLVLIALLGAALALALSEDLRKAVLDRLFGAEEEFEYTSTTAPTPDVAATNAN